MIKNKLILFIDGSVNTKSKIGFGAYLAVPEGELSVDLLRMKVKIKKFEHTSSTKLELETLLWALSDIKISGSGIIVYTDSQNIMGLQGRRDKFEKNDYLSKKNIPLNNFELYQEFFRVTDQLACEFIKIAGHKRSNQKDYIDSLFTLVDRASRSALRSHNQ